MGRLSGVTRFKSWSPTISALLRMTTLTPSLSFISQPDFMSHSFYIDPKYISAHSAEVILSDFRPLKLQRDALLFLNLLLDDILANIITSSRSILTDRLKSGLLKTLPTTTGKDALLEAEMELHAYWQRPNAIKPSASQPSEHSFTVPLMIEVYPARSDMFSVPLTYSPS